MNDFETVAISSRIRLARNFEDYPFPGRLMRDPHAVEQAGEIVRVLSAELDSIDDFRLYGIGTLKGERAEYLAECNLISRDLAAHCPIAAALVSADERICIMINEEDHIREQYFTRGFDLRKAYEAIAGIDDAISACIPFAYDSQFGYLTACPTNLGTGLRASVMLFLPACSHRGEMRRISSVLTPLGLTVRGAFGEGSGTDGDMFQVSNEITLGHQEHEILSVVEGAVNNITQIELKERKRMKVEEGIALKDRLFRSLGILTSCRMIDAREFARRLADVKLGMALGFFRSAKSDRTEALIGKLDSLAVQMRPAHLRRLKGGTLEGKQQDAVRAEFVRKAICELQLDL